MSSPFGDGDEMREQGKWLTEKEAERLLDGVVPADRPDLDPIADRLGSLAQAFEASGRSLDLRALAAVAASETRLVPSEKGDPVATPASKADRPARQVSGLPKRRNPVLNALTAFIATTAGKVTVAAALTSAAATGGLAVTDNLPVLQDGNDPPVVTVVDEPATHDSQPDQPDDAVTDDADAADPVAAVEPCAGLEGAAHSTCEDQLDDHGSDAADDSDSADGVDDHADESDALDDHDAEDQADEADQADEVDQADEADQVDQVDQADEVHDGGSDVVGAEEVDQAND